ncbi:MAG: hypothetical protein H6684_10105 [Deltaproteobacteria bacterium]|nr:hypothetical protein [Deltaproteobacteria bacterium]
MLPFIEIGGEVYEVLEWEPDCLELETYTLRRLPPEKVPHYQEHARDMMVELWALMNSPEN